ncbi:MAG: haloalkane dehalogenase [Actinomycetota bacterium]
MIGGTMTSRVKHLLRTADDRFTGLDRFPYEPRYLDADGQRVHYVDEGPAGAPPVLLVHGWPSWSYLWRNVIPPLLTARRRVVAADLFGFGRSDKPASREDVAVGDQVRCLRCLVSTLGLTGATLVVHDWGGLVGLRVAAEQPDRFAAVVAVNALLPTGDRAPGDRFLAWQWSTQTGDQFSAGEVIAQGTGGELPDEVLDAYDAPFDPERLGGDEPLDAAAREFPMLIPTRPENPESQGNRDAWAVFGAWTKPFVALWSDDNPVVGGGDRFWHEVPGAAGQAHVTVQEESLYLVEDHPELVTEAVLGLSPDA